jgi:hypothetical protein
MGRSLDIGRLDSGLPNQRSEGPDFSEHCFVAELRAFGR